MAGLTEDTLDRVDWKILRALQEDARGASSRKIAERTGTSASTVRKRIQRLETRGVIKGYAADLDYGKAGYPLRMLLFCTAPITERAELIEPILDIPRVVAVQELVTGERNLLVTAVGRNDQEITSVARALVELGVTVADEVLVRGHARVPFVGAPEPEELEGQDR